MTDALDLYAQYAAEREGLLVLRVPNGFATYRQVDQDVVYVVDIFVEKDFRRSGVATQISKQLSEIVRGLGATKMLGSIDIRANGVTESMSALLFDGFRFSHADGTMLYFVKMVGD